MRVRVTTGLLNRNHGGGLITSRKSLLSYVQSGKTGGSARLSALQGKLKNGKAGSIASTAASKSARAGYERLEKSASALEKQAAEVSEKAKEEGLTADAVEKLIGCYNDTLKELSKNTGSLNLFYQQSLKQTATDHLDALKEIGISYDANGSLALNKEKFSKADAEKIKAVLGGSSGFAVRAGIVAGRVADNAAANAQTASSRYNAGGDIAGSYFSRYNFRG